MPDTTPQVGDVSHLLKDVGKDDAPDSKPRSSSSGGGRQTPTLKQIEDRLNEMLAVAIVPTMLRNQYDGEVLASKGPDVITNIMRLARENPRIKKILDTLVVGSTYAELVMSVAAVAVPIMVNHGALPGVDPSVTTFFGSEAPTPSVNPSGNGSDLNVTRLGLERNDGPSTESE